jgi:lipoprotein NlpI
LDPNLGIAHLLRAEILVSLGSKTSAKEALHLSDGLTLPTYQHYVERADLHASFGAFDLAFSDLREALQINPDQTALYIERAQSYAETSNSQSGFDDFMSSIP